MYWRLTLLFHSGPDKRCEVQSRQQDLATANESLAHFGAELHMAEAHKVREVHLGQVDRDRAVDLLALREPLPGITQDVEVVRHLAQADLTKRRALFKDGERDSL